MKPHKFSLTLFILLLLSACSTEATYPDISQQQLLQNSSTGVSQVILDVRTIEEFSEGHIPLAINISHDEIAKNIAGIVKLTNNRETPLVIYCRSGYRAGLAIEILQENGFTNISHLEGDMIGWNEAKLPLDK